jgi:hypothetical protein
MDFLLIVITFLKFSSSKSIKNNNLRKRKETPHSSLLKKKMQEMYESFDYDSISDIHFFSPQRDHFFSWMKDNELRGYMLWLYVLIIGILCGCIAYWMTFLVGRMVTKKWNMIGSKLSSNQIWSAYGLHMMWVFIMILGAAILVYWAPEAAGSGDDSFI